MACRQAASFLREKAAGTYGKSFRYWAKGPQGNRMVFGVNVSGEWLNAPPANLYVWIPTGGLAEVSGMTAESVRGAINQRHSGRHSTDFDLVVRIHSLGACRELAPSKQESTTYEPSLVCKLLILRCRLLIPDRLLEEAQDLINDLQEWVSSNPVLR